MFTRKNNRQGHTRAVDVLSQWKDIHTCPDHSTCHDGSWLWVMAMAPSASSHTHRGPHPLGHGVRSTDLDTLLPVSRVPTRKHFTFSFAGTKYTADRAQVAAMAVLFTKKSI